GSLGQVCAVGIASNMIISIFLLPVWWDATVHSPQSMPSSLYRAEFWRAGLFLVRVLPAKTCACLRHLLAEVYWRLAKHRREIVIQNLLAAAGNDQKRAKTIARELFHQFALKLVDLWRYEAGLSIDDSFGDSSGWEHFAEAQRQKHGILLVTPHLGNWEFG